MASLSFVLDGGGVNCDASSLFLGGLVDLSVLNILGSLFFGQELGDGRSESGFTMINMANCPNCIR